MDIKAIASKAITIDNAADEMVALSRGTSITGTTIIMILNDYKPLPMAIVELVMEYHKDLLKWNNKIEEVWQMLAVYNSNDILQAAGHDEERGMLDDVIYNNIDYLGNESGDNANDWQLYFVHITEEKVLVVNHRKDQEENLTETLRGYLEKIRVLNNHT